MAPHVVALQAHTGRVGSAAFERLIKLHDAQKIKLVVIHRSGSDLSSVPANVEARELDLGKASEAKIKEVLSDVNVYISLVGIGGLADQKHLFKPLSEIPGFVTYLPPFLGQPQWTRDAPISDTRIGATLQVARDTVEIPKQLGLGLTRLACGVFTDFLFDVKYIATDIDTNTVVLPTGAEDKGLPLTSAEALGEAIAEIASRDPESIKNQQFYTVDYSPTGKEIIDVFTGIHGAAPTIVPFTEEDYEKTVEGGGMMISSALYRSNWGSGEWGWEGERLGSKDRDFKALAEKYWAERKKTA